MIQYLMSKNIPTLPVRPSHVMVDAPLPENDPRWIKYWEGINEVQAWVKSPALVCALAKAVQGNDLSTYLQLEKLWMRSYGCGSKKWREMVNSLL